MSSIHFSDGPPGQVSRDPAVLKFATPRKLPKPKDLRGRVVVLDIAFASEAGGGSFQTTTKSFIDALGPRLAGWVDHHDSTFHALFAEDPRFVLTTKAEHGACPELVTPQVVERIGPVDTIVCHNDFDGLVSAAKWLRKGVECYPGSDEDARAVDTCLFDPSPIGRRIERALRAKPRDEGLFGLIVRHLQTGLSDAALWLDIDEAAKGLDAIEKETESLARRYAMLDHRVAFVDATKHARPYDKTMLLLLGQKARTIAIVRDGDSVTVAAPFDSGLNFLSLLGLSGGMPTRVSVPQRRLPELLSALGVPASAAGHVDEVSEVD